MPRRDDYDDEPQPRSSFGKAFGLSSGCILGVVFALGLVLVAGVLLCAGLFGGCFKLASDVAKQAEEQQRREKEESLVAPRSLALSEKSQVGHVAVEITNVRVGQIPVKNLGGDDAVSATPVTAITIRVSVTDPTKKYEYVPWSGRGLGDTVRLTDRSGNEYKPMDFGWQTTVPGRAKLATIFSDAPITDVLVFDRPVPGADELLLDIRAGEITPGAFFRFRIPKSAWATVPAPTGGAPQPPASAPKPRPNPPEPNPSKTDRPSAANPEPKPAETKPPGEKSEPKSPEPQPAEAKKPEPEKPDPRPAEAKKPEKPQVPTRLVTAEKGTAVLALTAKDLEEYRDAFARSSPAAARMVEMGVVQLVKGKQTVEVRHETTRAGIAYVRPVEGIFQGRLVCVEERFLK